MLPAPIGWGSERRDNAAGALSPHGSARQSPHCRALPQSLGLASCGAGLALRRIETPRAFHGFNQQLGTNRRGSITGQLFCRRRHRGLASASQPPLAFAPLREVNDGRPRPGLSPSCRWAMPSSWGLAAFPWTHRRDASNPLLQPTFRVTSTRSKNTCSGDFPPRAVGKPAGVRLRDPPRNRALVRCSGRRRTTSRSSSLQRLRA